MASDFDIGVQSVVFQDFSLSELLEELESLDVTHLELWGHHLSPEHDDAVVAAGLDALAESSIKLCGFGVADLEGTGEARDHFAFADRLGAEYVTVNYPPHRDDITEELIGLGNEFGMAVGIHNYSSVHHDDLSQVFSTIDDVRGVLERYDDDCLGVCIDTGHFLVEDVTPSDVIAELGDRVNSVHLKDTTEADIEDVPGTGELDLPTLFRLIDEHTDLTAPLVIEYELPQDRAVEALEEAVGNVQHALD